MIWNQVRITAASLVLAGTLATGVVVGATQFDGAVRAKVRCRPEAEPLARRRLAQPPSRLHGCLHSVRSHRVSPTCESQINATNRTFDRMLSRVEQPGRCRYRSLEQVVQPDALSGSGARDERRGQESLRDGPTATG